MSLYSYHISLKKISISLTMNVTYQTTVSVAPTAQTEDELGAVTGGSMTSRRRRGKE